MVARSQLTRVEALENWVEVLQRAPLGTLWLRAADYATDDEEWAIHAACCEEMRERGYQPMVIVLISRRWTVEQSRPGRSGATRIHT